MAALQLLRDADWLWSRHPANPAADQDIVSFAARSPHLLELAFTLADHGHTHVGHVARLTAFTIADLANGQAGLARDLRLCLQHAGLDFEMRLSGWVPPESSVPDPRLDG